MPCYYTGSAEGDRALAAEEAITKNLTPLSKISNKKQVIFYGEEYRLVTNEQTEV